MDGRAREHTKVGTELCTLAQSRVDWMARLLTRSAPAPFLLPVEQMRRMTIAGPRAGRVLYSMAALLVILFATIGLAVRAVTYRNQWSAADSETAEVGLVDTCARTFVLVLLSLLGLLALGVMYGNVLGTANASP
jgi:hypothetical protein